MNTYNVNFSSNLFVIIFQVPLNGQYLSFSIDYNSSLCLGELAGDVKCISVAGFDTRLFQWIGFENGDWYHWPGNNCWTTLLKNHQYQRVYQERVECGVR